MGDAAFDESQLANMVARIGCDCLAGHFWEIGLARHCLATLIRSWFRDVAGKA
jgi:hypothetical protein